MKNGQNFVDRSFTRIGVQRQENSLNLWMAVKQFERSCKICSETGKNILCDGCPIKAAFINNAEFIFYDQATPAIMELVMNERKVG